MCHHVHAQSGLCCLDHGSLSLNLPLGHSRGKETGPECCCKVDLHAGTFDCFILPPPRFTIDAFSVSALPSMPHQNVPDNLLRALSKFPTKNKRNAYKDILRLAV